MAERLAGRPPFWVTTGVWNSEVMYLEPCSKLMTGICHVVRIRWNFLMFLHWKYYVFANARCKQPFGESSRSDRLGASGGRVIPFNWGLSVILLMSYSRMLSHLWGGERCFWHSQSMDSKPRSNFINARQDTKETGWFWNYATIWRYKLISRSNDVTFVIKVCLMPCGTMLPSIGNLEIYFSGILIALKINNSLSCRLQKRGCFVPIITCQFIYIR